MMTGYRGAVLSLLSLAVLTGGLSWQRPPINQPKVIKLQFNGLGWQTDTRASDIAELLLQDFGSYEGWMIEPPHETALTDQMTVTIQDPSASVLEPLVAANLKAELKKQEEAKRQTERKSPIYAGLATWYDFGSELTAASRQFPKGTHLRVVAVNSGKTIDVMINDYGPQAYTGIQLDLNRPAFLKLAPLGAGKIGIKYFRI